MKTAVINIKAEANIKREAQAVAEELGLSLSAVINGFLKHLVRTKRIEFNTSVEEPSDYLIQALKESEKDIKAGRVHSFNNASDAIAFLDGVIDEDNEN